MQSLPIDSFLPEVMEALRAHSAAILTAAPGAGKTTRVPPALIASQVLGREAPHLIMLQPRRVAARAAAQRIAEENGWRMGEEVGYHIRFEKRYGAATRIRVLTEAILTRILLDDPYLEGIGCVILDEFHERNLHTDLAIAFLREIQQTVRPDLKLLVMSATLDAEPVAAFLGGVPVLHCEGRTFPVEIAYRAPRDLRLEDQIGNVAREALEREGDVLIFLPGVGEIERVRRALGALERDFIAVLPLHGSLSAEEQQRALRADPGGKRKIVLATNIAETSLTIDGVRTVIDAGLVRTASFDADRGMDRLDLERISQASAAQRAGRAGRQGPGIAYRLWPELEQKHLAAFNVPEVQRVDLAASALAVHAWGAKSIDGFGWFERPALERIHAADALLHLLGALAGGVLTEVGRQMLKLAVHPRLARMVIAAMGTPLLGDAIALAAVLSDDARSSRANPLGLLHPPPPHLARVREQLARTCAMLGGGDSRRMQGHAMPRDLAELLLLAYPDRVARRRENDPHAAVMVGGSGVRLAKEALTPAIAESPLFLALDVHHDPRNRKAEALVHSAIAIEETALARLFAVELRTENVLKYDAGKEKVIAGTRRYFSDLLLEEDPHGQVDAREAGPILAAALAPRAGEIFERDEAAARLLARIALLRHAMPETSWPTLDDSRLRELLVDACAHKRALAELTRSQALADAVRSVLAYPLDRQLDQLAPEAMEVPSGSRIKIEYALPPTATAPPPAPILAVRLQEIFGLLETPRIAGGRVALLLHLLSPGYKPIQITQDLRSFWASAYFEVRKDLRTRYPKHQWPDDPLHAAPEAKGRGRRL